MYKKVFGKPVLVFGDLHISDRVTGKHKNYLENCFTVLNDIRDIIRKEQPSAVVFLGDLVGTVERNLKNREVLATFCKFFKEIEQNSTVFVVRGNHDYGDYTDYQFLEDLGMMNTSANSDGFFDYFATESSVEPEIRFHLVDYSSETRELDILTGSTSNVVLAHNNFTIQGITNWYQEHDGIELSRLTNFHGVDMVVTGHIHNPSPEIVATDMVSGGSCALFYPGCPTRPSRDKNLYTSCWYAFFRYNPTTQQTDYDAKLFPLRSIDDVFFTDDTFVDEMSDEDIENMNRNANLKATLDDIIKCRILTGDVIQQVKLIPDASEAAVTLACTYLQNALDMGNLQ